MLMTEATFLHNTKIATSAINEKKAMEKSRNKMKPQGRRVSLLEIFQGMLGYAEVHMDISHIKVSTQPLPQRTGVVVSRKSQSKEEHDDNNSAGDERNVDLSIVSQVVRKEKSLPEWRQLRDNEVLVLEGALTSSVSVDKVTQFSVRPPELRSLFNKVEHYVRWFKVGTTELNFDAMIEIIDEDMCKSCWIDGMQRQVLV